MSLIAGNRNCWRAEMTLIFDERVQVELLGRAWGDFHPTKSAEAHILLVRASVSHKFAELFLPSVAFTNRVAGRLDSNAFRLDDVPPLAWRTTTKADGGIIVNDPSVAVGICNADCHIGVIYEPRRHILCVVHLGLKCFHRPDGEPSILQEAIKVLRCDSSDLLFTFGGGAGPCCFGYDLHDPKFGDQNIRQAQDLRNRFGEDAVKGEVERGPRRGFAAHDLPTMILRHAQDLGLAIQDIDFTCTSCAGLKVEGENEVGERMFWSNLRGDVNNRNFFFARLVG